MGNVPSGACSTVRLTSSSCRVCVKFELSEVLQFLSGGASSCSRAKLSPKKIRHGSRPLGGRCLGTHCDSLRTAGSSGRKSRWGLSIETH